MSIDLIDRAIYLNSKGESEPIERLNNWIEGAESDDASEFLVEDEKYYWKIISSDRFKDIIDEDITDWFLIYSERREFRAMGKVHSNTKNLIGEKTDLYLSSLWIFKSNIESIKIEERPIYIFAPYSFKASFEHLTYNFKQLLTKLKDPKVSLIEFVSYKISKSGQRRIR
ncbi:hypothetical protein ACPPVU_23940 [Mucilaginibacter sp. McL0603]|uniref:hypothetical protein n=1 Tax=Mucilaginibacter sp. McL0603 TaxID=3415670 RepID=UPI003CF8C417